MCVYTQFLGTFSLLQIMENYTYAFFFLTITKREKALVRSQNIEMIYKLQHTTIFLANFYDYIHIQIFLDPWGKL